MNKDRWKFTIPYIVIVVFTVFVKNNQSIFEKKPLPDIILGSTTAPITIVYFYSCTCRYCKKFHKKVLPVLKEKYVDTGIAKIIFHEFIDDKIALQAACITRCLDKAECLQLSEKFLEKQNDWIKFNDPINSLLQIAQQFGFNKKQLEKCTHDENLINSILLLRVRAEHKYHISSTPSFIIQGELHEGFLDVNDFDSILKKIREK